jgi:plasmid maintenance system antidote protein VapI
MSALAEYLTDADPVRDHVRRLRNHGGTYEAIASAAGLAPMTVHAIMHDRRRVHAETASALLAVSGVHLDRRRLDAGGTRLRLRSLFAMGHGSARIAGALAVHQDTVQKLVRGQTATVSPELAAAAARVWDAWWDKRPPETTRDERVAACAARRRAARHDWCTALGLDEDELDEPGYSPGCGWRPAFGTGTAADITPVATVTPIRRRDTTEELEIA